MLLYEFSQPILLSVKSKNIADSNSTQRKMRQGRQLLHTSEKDSGNRWAANAFPPSTEMDASTDADALWHRWIIVRVAGKVGLFFIDGSHNYEYAKPHAVIIARPRSGSSGS